MAQLNKIAENTDIRIVQTLIDEAIALGLRVVHKPDPKQRKVVNIREAAEHRRMQMCVSPEAA
jgi:hypothetical protein